MKYLVSRCNKCDYNFCGFRSYIAESLTYHVLQFLVHLCGCYLWREEVEWNYNLTEHTTHIQPLCGIQMGVVTPLHKGI